MALDLTLLSKMEDACMDCKTWEEEMYWTHFQAVRFSLFLHGDFTRRLAIPKKITDNLRGKLPETLVLKGPGTVSWTVGLTSEDNTMFLQHGWGEFIKDNYLEENDFLILKYNKQSSMDVLMFDGQSLCEKESSYFVRSCGHDKAEDIMDAIPTASPVTPQCTSPGEPKKEDKTMPEQLERGIAARVKRLKTRRRDVRRPRDAKKSIENGSPSISVEVGKGNRVDLVNEVISSKGSGSCTSVYESRRRAVTEEEKNNALRLALAASTAQCFLVVMRPTHVYKRFYMSIPADWVTRHLSPRSQGIILRYQEKTWQTKYQHTARGTGGLTGGWKSFALDNDLEEFDVCLFEPVNGTTGSFTLDVTIFRVVNDVAPLSQTMFY